MKKLKEILRNVLIFTILCTSSFLFYKHQQNERQSLPKQELNSGHKGSEQILQGQQIEVNFVNP